jgi:hypothetical protein
MNKIRVRDETEHVLNFNRKKREKTFIILVIIYSILTLSIYSFITKDLSYLNIDRIMNIDTVKVYGQMNFPNGSSTTILGDIVIPSNSNNTMTTAADGSTNNTDKNTSPTAINKTLSGQNVTSAVNILREDRTFPISPTGISTQGLQQPPEHRIINNSNIPVNR